LRGRDDLFPDLPQCLIVTKHPVDIRWRTEIALLHDGELGVEVALPLPDEDGKRKCLPRIDKQGHILHRASDFDDVPLAARTALVTAKDGRVGLR